MGFLILIALLALSGWILFAAFQRLSSHGAGITWWMLFCSLIVFGVVIGHRLAFDFEYNVSPNLRIVSFPIPVCAFHLERGDWVGFPSPNYIAYPALFTNVVAVTAFAVLPLLVASLLLHRKGTQKAAERPRGDEKAPTTED